MNTEEESLAVVDVDNEQYRYSPTKSANFDTSDLNEHLWPEYCNPSYRMPPVIEVKVALPQGDYFFPVIISKAASHKSYLGGYRNKMTGKVYHHGSSQTPSDRQKKAKDTSNLRSRETQTYETRTLSIQSYRESGTQMERIDLRLDNKGDAFVSPKRYVTAYEVNMLKKVKTIEIQRYWRGYMARCMATELRKRSADFDMKLKEERNRILEAEKLQRMEDMKKRTHPRTNSDFATLYNELDVWRQAEMEKVKKSMPPGEERTQAMADLLTKETKALQSIQRLKVTANRDTSGEKTQRMLELMSQPHVWQLSNGSVAQVETPASVRARELLELYQSVSKPLEATDERLDILLHVKWTVREFDTPLTRDIADLVDREADLLNRGRPLQTMEKLRTRLSNLLLQFIETPEYNPRVADFIGGGKNPASTAAQPP